jgi:hypothetical protein
MRILIGLLALVLTFTFTATSGAHTGKEKDEQQKEEPRDLEALRRAAAAEAEKEESPEEAAEDKVFKSGGLGLQKLNPEISITGDMLGDYRSGENEAIAWNTRFRGLGIHMEAYLDPYSRFKAAVPVSTEGAELGEAYFTRYGLIGNTNLTLGKFRQQFGIVNRWHKHGLDWFDFPLALRSIFGPGGLNQIGLSFQASGATGRVTHGLIVEVTDGMNPRMFGGNSKNRPSILGHYNAYQDLSPSTYLEVGLTGLVGWNDAWTIYDDMPSLDVTVTDTRTAAVYGADLNLLWEPTGRMRYRNIQWRGEFYFVDKDIQRPDGGGTDKLNPWGLYSLVQAKVSRTVEMGARYDYFRPDSKDYASSEEYSLAPLAVSAADPNRHLAGAWLTWWQSPFVKFRGGYTYETTEMDDSDVHSVTFQMVFAAGPHKHERY